MGSEDVYKRQDQYRVIKKDEARRIKVEKQENERLEKIKRAREKQKQEDLKFKLKEQTLKEEIKIEKQRTSCDCRKIGLR